MGLTSSAGNEVLVTDPVDRARSGAKETCLRRGVVSQDAQIADVRLDENYLLGPTAFLLYVITDLFPFSV